MTRILGAMFGPPARCNAGATVRVLKLAFIGVAASFEGLQSTAVRANPVLKQQAETGYSLSLLDGAIDLLEYSQGDS